MREACEERGEIFTHEFGHSLFEALSDLGELRPWKIFSTDFAIYVTIRHSKYFENTPFNAPNLTNLINKRGVGIEGLDFMDGRKERIICVMGHTDPNSSGFSVLNDLDAFLTFIPKPYVIEQVPSGRLLLLFSRFFSFDIFKIFTQFSTFRHSKSFHICPM